MKEGSYKNIVSDIMDISKKYLSPDVDKNRLSTFGYITEAMATSVEDSTYRHILSLTQSIVELSNNSQEIKAVAKIRGLGITRPTPSKISAVFIIKKEDILIHGTKDNRDYHFILNRRSSLIVNDIPFTLADDIKISAMWHDNKYFYSASYMNSTEEHLILYNISGNNEVVGILLNLSQIMYTTHTRTITDIDTFTYMGMQFDHRKLYDFYIEYKNSETGQMTIMEKRYYRYPNELDNNVVLYDDDDDWKLILYNNKNSSLKTLDEIKITLKETLGSGGNFTSTGSNYSFHIYSDEVYKYHGVDIQVKLMSDATGGKDVDDIDKLKQELINQKISRNILVTDKDIYNAVKYKNDVIIIKRRNDMQLRYFNLYQILRNNGEVVPSCTKNIILTKRNFSTIDISNNKVIPANKLYVRFPNTEGTLMQIRSNPPSEDTIIEYGNDPNITSMICPFAYNINKHNLLTYYLNVLDIDFPAVPISMAEKANFHLMITNINIKRNPYLFTEDSNKYTVTITTILNGTEHDIFLNDMGGIANTETMIIYMCFNTDNQPSAYLPIPLKEIDNNGNIIFSGSFTTDDFITDKDKLSLTGLSAFTSSSPSSQPLVMDYNDVVFNFYITHINNDTENTKYNLVKQNIPIASNRNILSHFANKYHPIDLITNCSKFTNSPVSILPKQGDQDIYKVYEVPLIKYEYLKNNYSQMYKILKELEEYNRIIERLVDNTLNIKFINTYGESKNLYVGEDEKPLKNLNPVLKFKLYGKNVDTDEVTKLVKGELSGFRANNENIFITNIASKIEENPNINSAQFVSIDSFDSNHQKIKNKLKDN